MSYSPLFLSRVGLKRRLGRVGGGGEGLVW
jgi:hypothetical protein